MASIGTIKNFIFKIFISDQLFVFLTSEAVVSSSRSWAHCCNFVRRSSATRFNRCKASSIWRHRSSKSVLHAQH